MLEQRVECLLFFPSSVPGQRPSRWLRWSKNWRSILTAYGLWYALAGSTVTCSIKYSSCLKSILILISTSRSRDQRLSQLSATLFTTLDHVLQQVKPDCLLAQGDTTTVLVASLVAYYHGSRFGHVEAGLRTGDRYRPFPEEVNRTVADQLADYLFAPT